MKQYNTKTIYADIFFFVWTIIGTPYRNHGLVSSVKWLANNQPVLWTSGIYYVLIRANRLITFRTTARYANPTNTNNNANQQLHTYAYLHSRVLRTLFRSVFRAYFPPAVVYTRYYANQICKYIIENRPRPTTFWQ